MLEIDKMDTSSYQEIFTSMQRQLEEKSHLQFCSQDMEIVFLEYWALFFDMQNYTMDLISKQMEINMKRFLNEPKVKEGPMECLIFMNCEKSQWVLPHQEFHIQDAFSYEVDQLVYIQENEILSMKVKDERRTLNEGDTIELSLAKPLDLNIPCTLYVEVQNNRIDAQQDYPQAEIQWEIFNKRGWCKMDFDDETIGFLKNGKVVLTPCVTHELSTEGYQIRCIIKTTYYDELPILNHIRLNPVHLIQTKTWIASYKFPYQTMITLKDALALHGHIEVYGLMKEGYVSITYTKKLEGNIVLLFLERLEAQTILVNIYDLNMEYSKILASTDGVSMQIIEAPCKDIYKIQCLLKQEAEWHEMPIYEEETIIHSRYGARINHEQRSIQLGNGRDFLIPKAGNDNVLISELVTSKRGKGQISEHILDQEGISQPYPSFKQTIRVESSHSMASASHLKELIMALPGSRFLSIEVYSHPEQKGYLVILAAKQELKELYVKQVKRWVNQHNPIGFEVEIKAAHVLHFSLHVDLHLKTISYQVQTVKTKINEFLKHLPFGATLQSTEIRNLIMTIENIEKVNCCDFIIESKKTEIIQLKANETFFLDDIDCTWHL